MSLLRPITALRFALPYFQQPAASAVRHFATISRNAIPLAPENIRVSWESSTAVLRSVLGESSNLMKTLQHHQIMLAVSFKLSDQEGCDFHQKRLKDLAITIHEQSREIQNDLVHLLETSPEVLPPFQLEYILKRLEYAKSYLQNPAFSSKLAWMISDYQSALHRMNALCEAKKAAD
jgi:hypothetical protein